MLILAPVYSRDLVKDIPPISLMIMGAPGSLFFTGKEFIMIELTDKSQILVIKHAFVMNFRCNPLCLFACFIYNIA